jgi:hypothetical protein
MPTNTVILISVDQSGFLAFVFSIHLRELPIKITVKDENGQNNLQA